MSWNEYFNKYSLALRRQEYSLHSLVSHFDGCFDQMTYWLYNIHPQLDTWIW